MTIISDKIKHAARAFAVLAALGATAFTAMPAQAQSFGFSFGNDNGRFGFHIGDDDNDFGRRCISRSRIDDAIERQGYRNVRIRDYGRRVTEATGVRGGWRYGLVVNSCTGNVIDRDRQRRV